MAAQRPKNSVVLAKIEAVEGAAENPSAATDAILVENARPQFPPQHTDTNEHTGSLDDREPIVGGLKASLDFDVYLKGSGAAGTPPEFGDLLKACGWAEVITSAALPAAPEACAAGGSTTLAVLGASAPAVAQQLRGMPVNFTGAVAGASFISDYTASKQATLTDTMGGAIVATTNWQVPPNVLYKPASTGIPALTLVLFRDGLKYVIAGARGTFRLQLPTGGAPKLSFNFTGMFVSKTDVAVPAATFDATRPPIFKSGVMSIGRLAAATSVLSLDLGARLAYPSNPNAAEGFDPSEITSRRMSGSIDPQSTLVATRDLLADLRAGTQRIIHARLGSVSGNRIGLTIPTALFTGDDPDEREEIGTEKVEFRAVGQDAGAFIALY